MARNTLSTLRLKAPVDMRDCIVSTELNSLEREGHTWKGCKLTITVVALWQAEGEFIICSDATVFDIGRTQ
eukprot:scaffold626015_cov22-Prasinocladus_malaysianus.AAC.1